MSVNGTVEWKLNYMLDDFSVYLILADLCYPEINVINWVCRRHCSAGLINGK